MKINIREYKEDDWGKVLEIFNEGKRYELKGSVDVQEIIPLNKDNVLLKSFYESTIIVAENDNDILGFAGYNEELVSFLFVDSKYYKKKIGSTLLENILSKTGKKAWLLVAKTNISAQKLYKKYKFQIVESFIGNYNGNKVEVLRLAINPELKSWENVEKREE